MDRDPIQFPPALQSSWTLDERGVRQFPRLLTVHGGESIYRLLRTGPLLLVCWCSPPIQVDPSRSQFPDVTRAVVELGVVRAWPPADGVEDMAQTEQLRTYRMTSRDILGHQYRAWRSKRVRWLPGCPEPSTLWTKPRREALCTVFPATSPSLLGLPVEQVQRGWRLGYPCRCSKGWG